MAFAKFLCIRRRLRELFENNPISIIFIAWTFFVSWRPLVLGFYHDDWASSALPIVTGKNFIESISGDPTRPLYVLIIFLLRWISSGSPIGFQCLLAVVNLLCAFGIGVLATNLFSGQGIESKKIYISISGMYSALLWLVFPWSLGYSAWPIMLPPLIGMLCTILGCIFLTLNSKTYGGVFASTILLVVPWFIYEATWFLWIPVGLIVLIKAIKYKNPHTKLLLNFIVLGVFQLSFILINRFAFSSGQSKRLSIQFLDIFLQNFYSLKGGLIPIIAPGWIFLKFGFYALILIFIFHIILRKDKKILIIESILIVSGLVGSQLIYAFAGYGMVWDGLSSRVTLPINFWLALFAGLIFSVIGLHPTKKKKIINLTLFALIFLPCSLGLLKQTIQWKRSWDQQKVIINNIPDSVLTLASDEAILLLELPKGPPPVYSFNAYWDINGALVYRIHKYKKVNFKHIYATIAGNGEIMSSWNGETLSQYWCREPNISLWDLEARKLFFWKYGSEYPIEIKAPYVGGCVQ